MDLSTNYLGLSLPHPLMPGASPFSKDLDQIRRVEDASAAAIVMHMSWAWGFLRRFSGPPKRLKLLATAKSS